MSLLLDHDGAVRALNLKRSTHKSDSFLLLVGQRVVTYEMVRCAAVEDERSIRGIQDLWESRILDEEKFVVLVIESLPTTTCLTCHGPSPFPCCPFTKLHILFVFWFVWIRWNVPRPCCTCSFGSPSIFLRESNFQDIFWKHHSSARSAPRNQNARVAPRKTHISWEVENWQSES